MRDSDRGGGEGRMGSVELTTDSSLDFSASPLPAQPLDCGKEGSCLRGSQEHFSFQRLLVGRGRAEASHGPDTLFAPLGRCSPGSTSLLPPLIPKNLSPHTCSKEAFFLNSSLSGGGGSHFPGTTPFPFTRELKKRSGWVA